MPWSDQTHGLFVFKQKMSKKHSTITTWTQNNLFTQCFYGIVEVASKFQTKTSPLTKWLLVKGTEMSPSEVKTRVNFRPWNSKYLQQNSMTKGIEFQSKKRIEGEKEKNSNVISKFTNTQKIISKCIPTSIQDALHAIL